MAGFDLLGRLFRPAGSRDGQFRALEPEAVPPPSPATARLPEDPEQKLRGTVAAKVLEGWLANRQQTLMPHTLNFRVLDPEEARLLLGIMAAAAQADGRIDDAEARQLPLALERVGAGEAEAREIGRLLAEPQPLPALLALIEDEGLAARAYAAALLSISSRGRTNRAFLDYLSARLGLAREVAASLERRYRA